MKNILNLCTMLLLSIISYSSSINLDIHNKTFYNLLTNQEIQPSGSKLEITDNIKIRLRFISPQGYQAQILLGVDSNATMGVDWGYDGLEISQYPENMYWMIENDEYKIQGIDKITTNTTLPMGLYTSEDGIGIIKIDEVLNAPNDIKIYLHDKDTDMYHDLKSEQFETFLNVGKYNNRFEITFRKNTNLNVQHNTMSSINMHYYNANNMIVIDNPELKTIKAITVINIFGQNVFTENITRHSTHMEFNSKTLSNGIYTMQLTYEDNNVLTKKILVK